MVYPVVQFIDVETQSWNLLSQTSSSPKRFQKTQFPSIYTHTQLSIIPHFTHSQTTFSSHSIYIHMARCKSKSKSLSLAALGLVICVTLALTGVGEGRVPFACDPKNGLTRGFKFCRTHVPIHVRVQDLIGRLTLPEKIRLVVNNAIAVPRLGIQGYEWWSEALHGVSNVGPGTKFGGAFPGATSFPQVITTAASFNQSLWQEIGRVRLIWLLYYYSTIPH